MCKTESLPQQFVQEAEARIHKMYAEKIEALQIQIRSLELRLQSVNTQRDIYKELLEGILRARIGLKFPSEPDCDGEEC